MNKRHPHRDMEREYITTDISLRELSRKHGISAHSLVVDQAKKLKWAEKRDQYQAKESEAFMSRHAARMADRQAELHDKAIDVIDEAIDKFRGDMQATEMKRIDGEWVEVPVHAAEAEGHRHPARPPARAVRPTVPHQRGPQPQRQVGAAHRRPEPDRGDYAGEGSATDITAAA